MRSTRFRPAAGVLVGAFLLGACRPFSLTTDPAEAVATMFAATMTAEAQIQARVEATVEAGLGPVTGGVVNPASTPFPELDLEILKNAYYRSDLGEGQLVDGIYYTNPMPGDPPETWHILLEEPIAFGDLDGDGMDDAVVTLEYQWGGTGALHCLAVVINQRGQAVNTATACPLDDRGQFTALEVDGDVVVADVLLHGPNDALCCPTEARTWTFRLVGNELLLESGELPYELLPEPVIFPPGPLNLVEDFAYPYEWEFTSRHLSIDEVQHTVVWRVERDGGDQFMSKPIPPFSGDVRITAIGRIDEWTGNCLFMIGLGDDLGTGVSINFGYYGTGCPAGSDLLPPGPVITASGVSLDFSETSRCGFAGNWLRIQPATYYHSELTILGSSATLLVPGVGQASGTVDYKGEYSVLYLGLRGDGDWPACAGAVSHVIIEEMD